MKEKKKTVNTYIQPDSLHAKSSNRLLYVRASIDVQALHLSFGYCEFSLKKYALALTLCDGDIAKSLMKKKKQFAFCCIYQPFDWYGYGA